MGAAPKALGKGLLEQTVMIGRKRLKDVKEIIICDHKSVCWDPNNPNGSWDGVKVMKKGDWILGVKWQVKTEIEWKNPRDDEEFNIYLLRFSWCDELLQLDLLGLF